MIILAHDPNISDHKRVLMHDYFYYSFKNNNNNNKSLQLGAKESQTKQDTRLVRFLFGPSKRLPCSASLIQTSQVFDFTEIQLVKKPTKANCYAKLDGTVHI